MNKPFRTLPLTYEQFQVLTELVDERIQDMRLEDGASKALLDLEHELLRPPPRVAEKLRALLDVPGVVNVLVDDADPLAESAGHVFIVYDGSNDCLDKIVHEMIKIEDLVQDSINYDCLPADKARIFGSNMTPLRTVCNAIETDGIPCREPSIVSDDGQHRCYDHARSCSTDGEPTAAGVCAEDNAVDALVREMPETRFDARTALMSLNDHAPMKGLQLERQFERIISEHLWQLPAEFIPEDLFRIAVKNNWVHEDADGLLKITVA